MSKARALTDSDLMPWGPHKGKAMKDVPVEHLLWCLNQAWIAEWPPIYAYLKQNEERIRSSVQDGMPPEPADGYGSFEDYLNDH